MIHLFSLQNYQLKVTPEALMLKPLRAIYEADKSKDKKKAMQIFAYIYFMEDPRSTYQMYTDRKQRHEEVLAGEGMDKKWEPDQNVVDAMKLYAKFKTTAALLLEDTRYAVDNLREMLRNIDMNATDNSGKPIYTMSSVAQTIKQVPALIRELDAAEKALMSENEAVGGAKGSFQKAMFEDISSKLFDR